MSEEVKEENKEELKEEIKQEVKQELKKEANITLRVIIVIILLVLMVVSFVAGCDHGVTKSQKDAVRHHAAEFYADEKGQTHFRYIESRLATEAVELQAPVVIQSASSTPDMK